MNNDARLTEWIHAIYSRQIHPRFWFKVDSMAPSRSFVQRTDSNESWLPPRPQHSNVLRQEGAWFEYYAGATRTVAQRPAAARHYKTYSFYINDGIIWIYPSDATKYKVGNGEGNPRVSRPDPAYHDEEDGSSSDQSTDGDNNSRPSTEDWRILGFEWCDLPHSISLSYAAFRGRHDTIYNRWQDQNRLQQLLPNRYFGNPPRPNVAAGHHGGLGGDLPILIALIVYSVRNDRAGQTLTQSLQRHYNPHQHPREEGWTNRRGLIVHVYCEPDGRDQQSPTAFERMRVFEYGRYPGYGPFVL